MARCAGRTGLTGVAGRDASLMTDPGDTVVVESVFARVVRASICLVRVARTPLRLASWGEASGGGRSGRWSPRVAVVLRELGVDGGQLGGDVTAGGRGALGEVRLGERLRSGLGRRRRPVLIAEASTDVFARASTRRLAASCSGGGSSGAAWPPRPRSRWIGPAEPRSRDRSARRRWSPAPMSTTRRAGRRRPYRAGAGQTGQHPDDDEPPVPAGRVHARLNAAA